MVSDELTQLMMHAQGVAISFERRLEIAAHSEDEDVSDVDFPATFVGERADGSIGITPLEKYTHDKDTLANILIPAAIREHNFVRCVLTFTAWAVEKPNLESMTLPLAEHPDRKEVYFISGYEPDGAVLTWANIDRKNPVPHLVNWNAVEEAENLLGRFAEPIVEVLKEYVNEES